MLPDDTELVELRGLGASVGLVFSQSVGIMAAMNETTH